jgi:hypothetical protein
MPGIENRSSQLQALAGWGARRMGRVKTVGRNLQLPESGTEESMQVVELHRLGCERCEHLF